MAAEMLVGYACNVEPASVMRCFASDRDPSKLAPPTEPPAAYPHTADRAQLPG